MTLEELLEKIPNADYYGDAKTFTADCKELILAWHIAEVASIIFKFESLLNKRNAKEFKVGEDCYIHVNLKELNECLDLIKRANGSN